MAELQPCGTTAAHSRHRYNNETPCRLCRDAVAADQKERRIRYGQTPNREPECGTHNGYCRHIYVGEPACDACKQAHSERVMRSRNDIATRRRRGSWRDVVVDYLETHGPMSMKELHYLITLRHDDLGMPTLKKTMRRLVNESVIDMRREHESAFGQGIYSYD